MPAERPVPVNQLGDRQAMGLPDRFVARSLGDIVRSHPELRSVAPDQLAGIASDRTEPLPRRLAAAARVAIDGDPRIDPLRPRMVDVDAATFTMGIPPERVEQVVRTWSFAGVRPEWIAKETPAHSVEVGPFAVAVVPVTCREYRTFLEETGYERLPASWPLGAFPWAAANHPVYGVDPQDAEAYTAWLSTATGRAFRLPTEAEWEYAASGDDGREYPWGDAFSSACANTVEGGPLSTTPVGVYLEGESPLGLLDMAGNVEEWVADDYRPYPGGPSVDDDLAALGGSYRVARGGSFARYGDLARCARRHGYFPRPIYAIGFRLAETLPRVSPPR